MNRSPPGPEFPEKIEGELAWKGAALEANPDLFTEYLTESDTAEIVAAIKHFKDQGVARGLADPNTFPLSEALAERLRSVADHVYNGRGFHRIKGFKPSHYTEEDRVIAYAGITSYVADQRARNIDHIRDRTLANPDKDELKPLELAVPMAFHTDIDTGDILTMFVQSTPLEGGDQYIASMATMYNDLLENDSEALKTLAEDWYWERAYRTAPYKEIIRTFNRPIIGMEGGRIQVNYAATLVGGNPEYPHSENAPPLSPQKLHAIKVIQESAERNCLRLKPESGDMLFINNYAMLHARSGWVDSRDDVWKQRYILRLWLRDTKKGWTSAPALKRVLDDKFDLGPTQQCLMTGDEWHQLPRPLRIKEMGVAASDCHD